MEFPERIAAKRLPLLKRLMEHFGLEPHVAEDLFQETTVTAMRNQASFRGGDDDGILFGWLRRIADNLALKWLSKHGRQQPLDSGELSDQAGTPSLAMRVDEARERLRAAVDRLPEGQREVVCWKFFENRSIREIAQTLDKTENAIYGLFHRGLKQLSEELSAEEFRTLLR